jgi:hypothetical protein
MGILQRVDIFVDAKVWITHGKKFMPNIKTYRKLNTNFYDFVVPFCTHKPQNY